MNGVCYIVLLENKKTKKKTEPEIYNLNLILSVPASLVFLSIFHYDRRLLHLFSFPLHIYDSIITHIIQSEEVLSKLAHRIFFFTFSLSIPHQTA